MELKEIKQLILFAQRNGIKRLRVGDISVSFQDAVIFPKKTAVKGFEGEPKSSTTVSVPDQPPSLEQINAYIYGQDGNPS
jgi:hypothetical protein